jgi:hypothetical protein
MRTKLALGILALSTFSSGCGPITLATRTLMVEPIHYCTTADNILEWRRDYKLAEAAWKEIEKATSASVEPQPLPHSPDYAKGFKDGFADYLYAGGTGEPPPLPPRQYWRMGYKTPEGHQAIEDWFAGFRHGAAAAWASGYRQWVTVPTSLPPREAAGLQPIAPENTAVPPGEPMLPPPRMLPAPRDPDKSGQEGGQPANPSPPSAPSDGPQDGEAARGARFKPATTELAILYPLPHAAPPAVLHRARQPCSGIDRCGPSDSAKDSGPARSGQASVSDRAREN